ncbi:hypothetical protein SAMN04487891_102444 [Flagellimonas taeanensis]|uniref:Uncharacterized protein n=1 Tax=Flagellimonas taeanensis TaxID=1005926 RepID=A0A1M6SGL5_9FLAO|nr:hypothetical protein [Allomuricauda taeanensis]SFB80683.1 hypothetical protein SAMN04487891_102444 [Allomuricauda taeanensis]SHK43881.1 hypothetical protein SAMN05216293_1124 [Allomuricauda taeanensis]
MKNLFFALAFMLVGTFAFANNTEKNTALLNETEMVTAPVSSEMVKVQTTVQEDLCADVYDVYIDGEYAGTIVIIYEC